MPFKNPIERKAYDKKWRLKHPNKVTLKSHKEKLKKYGMTLADFDALVVAQNSKCKICNQPFKIARRPCVDHCHTSGSVRGLLCINCNTALGFVQEDISILYNMISYIKQAEQNSTKFRVI